MALYVLVAALVALFAFTLVHAVKSMQAGAYALATLSLTFLVGVYCVGVLDYTWSGSPLGLQKRVDQIEVTQTELQTIVGTLTKMVLLLDSNDIADMSVPESAALVEEYKETIGKYLGPNFEEEMSLDFLRAEGKKH